MVERGPERVVSAQCGDRGPHYVCEFRCDYAPCTLCGWLCPRSNWTFEAAIRAALETAKDAMDLVMEQHAAYRDRIERQLSDSGGPGE